MKIAIVGTGYVGLVTGACFAEMGADVTCVDIDEKKISALKNAEIPFYEPGLDDLVGRNCAAGRLSFTTRLQDVINEVDAVFAAVGTPPKDDGAADLSYVYSLAEQVGRLLSRHIVFVIKSTVPVGTSAKVKAMISNELDKRGVEVDFDMASNPEFLKEGSAVKDFMSPDRVIVGIESEKAREVMTRLYKPFLLNNFRVMFMDIASAEMTKYASNAMLATRISFMNDIADLCELVGADVNKVRLGMGSDARIGNKFLYAGCGYGGSCFPKDVRALANTGREAGHRMRVLEAVDEVNEAQKKVLLAKLHKHLGNDLKGKAVALWGLAFKPNTDDMREAPSLELLHGLQKAGCTVRAFDPIVKSVPGFPDLQISTDIYEAAKGADAVCLVTEWKEFRLPNWKQLKTIMRSPVVIDGRNIYDPVELRNAGFVYEGIGVSISE